MLLSGEEEGAVVLKPDLMLVPATEGQGLPRPRVVQIAGDRDRRGVLYPGSGEPAHGVVCDDLERRDGPSRAIAAATTAAASAAARPGTPPQVDGVTLPATLRGGEGLRDTGLPQSSRFGFARGSFGGVTQGMLWRYWRLITTTGSLAVRFCSHSRNCSSNLALACSRFCKERRTSSRSCSFWWWT